MIKKLQSGDLTLHEFQQVLTNENQMNKLVSTVSGDLNLEIYSIRLKNFEDHEKAVRLLLDLLPKTYAGMCTEHMHIMYNNLRLLLAAVIAPY